MSPTATTTRAAAKPAAAPIYAYAGKLLRVNLSTGKTWTEAWSEADRREYVGGIGLGAKILYDEVGPKVQWDHPDNRFIMATGPLAGLPVWGTGGLTVITRGALTGGATSTQANGFFGAALKYSGYDAIVMQGQAKKLSYLYINDDVVEVRDAAHLAGKDTWETQQALETEHGLSGHRLSVYAIGPAGENLVRFAAIHGDYGHVASKNGCGAVMGKKKLKAVCIVRGTKALAAHDARGLIQVADDIAHDLKTDPSTSTLYNLGTLPGVVNLSKLGALPIKNYTTNLTGDVDMKEWEGRKLREGFDHRGHQCNACGMRHCHIQVIPSGPHAGDRVDEPEYEGWSGAGWTIGLTEKVPVSWLNTQIDRACVDVNEFGWVCGWVMECMEKGYLTEKQVGFRLTWGDVEGANKLLQMISHRQGFGDILAEGVKRASEKIGGKAAECAIYTMKGASPARPRSPWAVGRDARHVHVVQRDDGERQPHVPDRGRRPRPHQSLRRRAGGQAGRHDPRPAPLRGLAGRLLVHLPHPDGQSGERALRRDRLGLSSEGRGALRQSHRRDPARLQPPLRNRHRGRVPIGPLRLAAGRRPGQGARRSQALGPDARGLVRDGQLRPQDRQAQAGPLALARPRLARKRPLPEVDGRVPQLSGEAQPKASRANMQSRAHIEVTTWVTKHVGGDGTGSKLFDEAIGRGDTPRTVLRRFTRRFPELDSALWSPDHSELGSHIEVARQRRGAGRRLRSRHAPDRRRAHHAARPVHGRLGTRGPLQHERSTAGIRL